MTIRLIETIDSRQWTTGDKPTHTRLYRLEGVSDDLLARTLLLSSTPTSYEGLVREECTLEPIFVDTAESRGLWDCRVRYVPPEQMPTPTNEACVAFDTAGGTQHVTQSLGTVRSYSAWGPAPDFKGAIGVTHDSVEGVDITVPVFHFSETHHIPHASVNSGAYFAMTGKVNDASFRGLQAGECLFLGAAGSRRGEGDWEIIFRFAGSPNQTGLTIGTMTGIEKKGWEYLWVRYADTEDTLSHTLVKQPVAVYIEQVYRDGDFALLGIGT